MKIKLNFEKVKERSDVRRKELMHKFLDIIHAHLKYNSFRSLHKELNQNHGYKGHQVLPHTSDWVFYHSFDKWSKCVRADLKHWPRVQPLIAEEVIEIDGVKHTFYARDRENRFEVFDGLRLESDTPAALYAAIANRITEIEKGLKESSARTWGYEMQKFIEGSFKYELTERDFNDQKNLTARMLEDAAREVRRLRWSTDIQTLNIETQEDI